MKAPHPPDSPEQGQSDDDPCNKPASVEDQDLSAISTIEAALEDLIQQIEQQSERQSERQSNQVHFQDYHSTYETLDDFVLDEQVGINSSSDRASHYVDLANPFLQNKRRRTWTHTPAHRLNNLVAMRANTVDDLAASVNRMHLSRSDPHSDSWYRNGARATSRGMNASINSGNNNSHYNSNGTYHNIGNDRHNNIIANLEDGATGVNLPEEFAPEEFAPEEFAPEEFAPEEFAPEEVAPEEVAPEEVAPEGRDAREIRVHHYPGDGTTHLLPLQWSDDSES